MAAASPDGFATLPRQARTFILATLFAGAALTAFEVVLGPAQELDVTLLAVAAVLCAGANLFEVFAPGHYSLQPNFAFFFWAAVLLPPWAIAALAVICFLPGWAAKRFPWFKVAFNMANYLIAGLVAHAIVAGAHVFAGSGLPELGGIGALAAAAAAFAFVNHLLLVFVASFASGSPVRTGLHQLAEGFPLDAALAATGACLAVLWESGPAAALLTLGPIGLIYRALLVPQLEHRARTDPKTGLFNFAHFSERLGESLADAHRRGGSLAVVVVDLDHLREINNRFGHLVGDRVIGAVAEELGETGRLDATAARFGGEEFCLLLPDVSIEDARGCAEGLRERVAALRFREEDGKIAGGTVKVTLSAGIAAFPDHGDSADELLKAADLAVYEAKAAGRNRVRIALSAEARAAFDLRDAPPRPPDPTPLSLRLAGQSDGPPPPGGVERRRPREQAEAEGLATPTELPMSEIPVPVVGARRFLPAFAAAVTGAAVVGAALAGFAAVRQSPVLLVALVACVVVLDFVDLDLFGRGRVSPGAIPSLALAFEFGPAGPVAAEAIVWAVRLARREPLLKASFNFGSLGLSGAAAAGLFAAAPSSAGVWLVGAGGLAGLAYYAVNAGLVAGAWALDEGVEPLAAWRERFAWCTPYYVVFGALAGTLLVAYDEVGSVAFAMIGLPVAMLWLAQKQYLDHTRTSVTELRRRHEEATDANWRLRRLLEDKHDLLRTVHRSYLATITSLARTIEAKDPYTGGHTERVAEVALLLANELGFDEAECRAVGVGAVIHDIGKVGVPDDILLKPGRLSAGELDVIRTHPEISTYILAELELPPMVKEMVRHHHERFDGSGYPDGLVGEEIPLAARVLAVADALDAMTSDRPYRPGRPIDEARDEIKRQAGVQFCPRVVNALDASFRGSAGFWKRFERERRGQRAAGSVAV
jgi:diguanylate cyclase (GGDEF)-like protein/putative nucleotidyltransferase with HDIG domain